MKRYYSLILLMVFVGCNTPVTPVLNIKRQSSSLDSLSKSINKKIEENGSMQIKVIMATYRKAWIDGQNAAVDMINENTYSKKNIQNKFIEDSVAFDKLMNATRKNYLKK